MKFNEEFSSFEAQFADFGPRESVNFDETLKDENTHVSDREL